MNAFIRLLCIASLGLTAGACATIANGTTQAINIDSDPAGADCTLMRAGQPISAVTAPAPVTVKRDQQTIHVRCKKDGYEEALVVMNSRYEMASAGNILLGGVIGMMVDNSSGANAKYDPYVMVRMTALSPADQAAAAARPQKEPVVPSPAVASVAPAMPSEEYHGGVMLGSGAINLRDIKVRVGGGHAIGEVTQALCPGSGKIELTIDPSGAVSGEMDARQSGSCGPNKLKLDGRLESGILKLNVQVGDRTIAFSLTSSAPAFRTGSWTAHNVVIAEKSGGNCASSGGSYSLNAGAFTLNLAGDTLTVDSATGRLVTVSVPPSGLIDAPFRSASGAQLVIVGNARTRDLEMANPTFGCRWKLTAA